MYQVVKLDHPNRLPTYVPCSQIGPPTYVPCSQIGPPTYVLCSQIGPPHRPPTHHFE